MKMEFKSVDAYIDSFPREVQEKLISIRKIIIDNAPGVQESISYGMPAYKLCDKPLVYFAGFDKHIGFYATPTGHEMFAKELKSYKQGKGSVQFPLSAEMPYELITRMVVFRVRENEGRLK